MSILNDIKAAQLKARKEKNSKEALTLTTLIGEAEMIGKNDGNRSTTDEEVQNVIKKFIKNINETLKVLKTEQADKVLELNQEKEILMKFLPQQLTENELKVVILGLVETLQVTDAKGVGQVMKALKEKYDGQYDGSVASGVIKAVLAS